MTYKHVVFYFGCMVTWVLVLPVIALSGFTALVAYAVCSQIGDVVFGRGAKALDTSAAREIARRMCLGH